MADEVGESLKLNIKITSTGENKLKIIADSAAKLRSVLGGVVAPINELNAVSSSINTKGIKSVKAVMKDTAKSANEVAKAAKGAAKELENVKVGDNISNGIKNVALSSEKVSENLDRAQKSAGELGSSFQQVKQETAKVSEAVEQASKDDIAEAQKTAQAKAALLEKYNAKIRESLKTATEAAKFTPSNTLTDVQSAKNAAFSALAGTGLNLQTNQFAQTFASVEKALEKVENIKPLNKLIAQLRSGTITAGEFAKELEKINTAVKQTGGASARSGLKDFFKKLKDDANGAIKPISKLFKTIGRLALYRAIRAMLRGITDGFKTGIQNLARYSSEANASMSKLATASLYIKNSLGAAAMPIVEQMLPALLKLANYAVKALNAINQLMSALQGKSTYTRAKEYAVDYAATLDKSTSNASKSVQKLKRDLMGFDELNVLSAPDTGGPAGGGVDYSAMFEDVAFTDEAVQRVRDNFAQIAAVVAALPIAVGAILLITGHIGAGIALIIAGLALTAATVKFSGDDISENVRTAMSTIMGVLGGFLLALGIILTLTQNYAFGIPLILLGAGALVASAAISWNDTGNKVKKALTIIGGIVAGAVMAIGALLCLTGVGIGTGIALIALGAVAMVAVVALNWNGMSDKVKSVISIIAGVVGVASLVIGAILAFSGAGLPLGIALMAVGAVSLTASVALNWDTVKDKIKTVLSGILSIVSAATLILGVILLFSGVGLPLGLGLIAAGAHGIKEAKNWDDNVVSNKISGALDATTQKFEEWWGKLTSWWDSLKLGQLKLKSPHFEWTTQPAHGWIEKVLSAINLPTSLPKLNVEWYANGGFPEDGLFMANHNELVGRFSNGRTAVANNAQIQAGIEEAAYRGFMRAMSQSGGMGGQGGTYKFVAQLNGKTLFEEVVNQNNSTVKSTGNTPLLV